MVGPITGDRINDLWKSVIAPIQAEEVAGAHKRMMLSSPGPDRVMVQTLQGEDGFAAVCLMVFYGLEICLDVGNGI